MRALSRQLWNMRTVCNSDWDRRSALLDWASDHSPPRGLQRDPSGLQTQTANSTLSSDLLTLRPSRNCEEMLKKTVQIAKFTAISLASCNGAPGSGYKRLKLHLDGETIDPNSLPHDLAVRFDRRAADQITIFVRLGFQICSSVS